MTHLGLCSAVAATSKGFQTVGFDPDRTLCAALAAGRLPVLEPQLDEMLRTNRTRIEFDSNPQCLAGCDLVYVAPDVPTSDDGESDLTLVDSSVQTALDHTGPQTTIVILSQVPPGYTRARQRAGRELYYQVETLIFGRAMERAANPERFIVGCMHPEQSLTPALLGFLEAFGCPILPMRLESAELSKISINVCLAASITVANTVAELCERTGADWGEIAPALKLDRRIGPHSYLAPGLGIGGGNLGRDLATVLRLSEEYGTQADLIRAFLVDSSYRKDWALRTLHETVLAHNPMPVLAVLGLTYKENTQTIKNSPALALIGCLKPWPITVFDPAVRAPGGVHPALTNASSALEAAEGSDALLIMTPWPEFRDLPCGELARRMRGRMVIDPYRVLEAESARQAGLEHRILGAI